MRHPRDPREAIPDSLRRCVVCKQPIVHRLERWVTCGHPRCVRTNRSRPHGARRDAIEARRRALDPGTNRLCMACGVPINSLHPSRRTCGERACVYEWRYVISRNPPPPVPSAPPVNVEVQRYFTYLRKKGVPDSRSVVLIAEKMKMRPIDVMQLAKEMRDE